MSKQAKLLQKLAQANKTFKWSELVNVLLSLGFDRVEGAGSRVAFVKGALMINLHKPHPQKEIKTYVLRQVKTILKQERLL